jgi:hypothetical protein
MHVRRFKLIEPIRREHQDREAGALGLHPPAPGKRTRKPHPKTLAFGPDLTSELGFRVKAKTWFFGPSKTKFGGYTRLSSFKGTAVSYYLVLNASS